MMATMNMPSGKPVAAAPQDKSENVDVDVKHDKHDKHDNRHRKQ
jgi:hypothetical protein